MKKATTEIPPKPHQIFSISNQLRYGLVSIVASSLLIVGGALIYLSFKAHSQESLELQQERSRSAASEIAAHMEDLRRQLTYLSGVRGLTNLSPEAKRGLLEGLTNHNEAYEIVGIMNNAGRIVTAISPYGDLSPDEKVLLKDLAKSPLFIRAFKYREDYVSPVAIARETNLPVLALAVPIRNFKDEIDGVLFARINLNFLWRVVSQTKVGKTGYTYVIDERQIVLAQKNIDLKNFKLEKIKDKRLIKNLSLLEERPFITYRGLNGKEVLGAIAPVRRMNWNVVVELPTAEAYAPVRQMLLLMGGKLTIAIASAVVVGFSFSRKIVLPLEKLTTAAAQISSGNLETRVAIASNNELGILAKTFNEMAAQLADFYQSLEQMVASRTANLKEANLALENEIAERKQAETELQQALQNLQKTQMQLIQAEKMSSLGQLVAGIAHEINNPVNFIHGNLTHADNYIQELLNLLNLYAKHYPNPVPEIQAECEAIELEFLLEDLPNLLSSMKMGTNRIREIVLSLRNFSRLDEAEMKAANIHEGIESTLLILQNRLKAKPNFPGIEIIKNYENLPNIECYPGQLNQVFMNILSNAIDVLETQPPPRTIAIRTEVSSQTSPVSGQPEKFIIIRIADNGGGIPPEIKDKIFDPFFTTKPVGSGTGLGLSISYQIIEKHNGQISCTSKVGEGTEFAIALPLKRGPNIISDKL